MGDSRKASDVPTAAELRERNARFARLSPRAKRMAVARDVIAQIRAKRYVAEPGTYVDVKYALYRGDWLAPTAPDTHTPRLFQKAGWEPGIECRVCAIGAGLMSRARLGNKVYAGGSDELAGTFDAYQRATMEHAFEGGDMGSVPKYSDDESAAAASMKKKCLGFYNRRPNASRRLEAIYANILKNRGEFRP